jgi:hypothetical protein
LRLVFWLECCLIFNKTEEGKCDLNVDEAFESRVVIASYRTLEPSAPMNDTQTQSWQGL